MYSFSYKIKFGSHKKQVDVNLTTINMSKTKSKKLYVEAIKYIFFKLE